MVRLEARVPRAWGLVLATMLVMAMVPIAPAAAGAALPVIYVDPVAGDDATGSGSAADPFQSITHAMGYAGPGTTIYLQPGTYTTPLENFPIALAPGAQIVGLEGAEETIVDAADSGGVFYILNALEGTGLGGITVANGSVAGWAAGIQIYHDSAFASAQGWPVIMDCIITGNTAGLGGGGIMMEAENLAHAISPVILRCEISANSAGAANAGGGINVATHARPEIRECAIYGNSAGYGAGAYAYDGVFDRCDIGFNDAALNGGGLEVSGQAEIRDCWIGSNTAGNNGGGLSLNDMLGDFLIERTVIEDNSAGNAGGGVLARGAQSALFRNVVIDANIAGANGGAFYGEPYVTVTLDGCTVVDNASPSFKGIYVDDHAYMMIADSIVSHGGAAAQDVLLALGASCTMRYSLVSNTTLSGTGVIHGDPLFVDREASDFELQSASPCIDAADPASILTDDVLGRPRPEDGDGNGTARADMGAFERPLPEVDRIAGTNRYETAGIMAQWREWPGDTAVLASGMGFADALAGSGLAGAHEGPLLLTAKDSVPGIIMDALQDAGVSDVVIVGGTAVISGAVEDQLEHEGYVVSRIAGANRYATAAAVAEEIADIMGPGFAEEAFLARGDDFADALAASPLAYAQAVPVLLTATGSLPDVTRAAISDLGIHRVAVVGGAGAVSDVVENAVEAMPGVDSERIAGADRYATAVAVAAWGVDESFVTWNHVGIATGTNYPDALAGGALCGVRGGVLLLTQPTALPAVTRDALAANKADVTYAEVYGGASAVTDAVMVAIAGALGW